MWMFVCVPVHPESFTLRNQTRRILRGSTVGDTRPYMVRYNFLIMVILYSFLNFGLPYLLQSIVIPTIFKLSYNPYHIV